MNNLKGLLWLTLLFGWSGSGFSQAVNSTQFHEPVDVPSATIARLKALYESNEFAVKSFNASWLPDASGYLVLETIAGTGRQVLAGYDVVTGKRTEWVSAEQLILPEVTIPLVIDRFDISPDGGKILLQARQKAGGNGSIYHWILDQKSGSLLKVVAGRNSSVSPDGTRILYEDRGNLIIYDSTRDLNTPITHDAVDGTITYERAEWSPDGKRVAFVLSDDSRVSIRSSLVPGDPSYPEVNETRFARVGGIIPSLRVGVADIEGKEITWLPVPVPLEGYYLGQVSWAGNSHELLIEKFSRFRDKREFFLANISSGAFSKIYEESDPAWVIASYATNDGLEWIRNYRDFIVISEKEGWRQAYICSRDGLRRKKITPGEFDIIERVGVDQAGGWFYFCASPENGTRKYLFRVSFDGSDQPEKITPADQPGTHTYNMSPDGKWAFHTYSSDTAPPVTALVKLPEHRVVRVLEDNKALRKKVEALQLQPKEFFTLDIGQGIEMDAWMIKPKDFDPSRKYPVFVYVYGEPHGQTVIDSWGHSMADFHRVIADLGYLVVSIDNRGTPCPKGAAWRRAVSGSLGPLSTEEQAAGIRELGRTRSYVDISRVGIWGWSGGGSNTLNAMFRKPDVYQLGIAVAPKPQPHLYNAWFQEIYMKTQEVNPEGYKASAPINFAEGLKGHLLIIHGTGETNTHIQITEGLVDRLIELGKPFDYMAYPHRDHGIREGKGTSLHLRILMARYLLNNLPAGPR